MTIHQMQLISTTEDGRELWECPVCGYAFLINWPPAYHKIVLEEGDSTVTHSGGKGGLVLQPPKIVQEDEVLSKDDDLSDYEDFMNTLGEP